MRVIIFFGLLLSLSSCVRDVEVILPEHKEKMVVEGHIEPGEKAYVFLSKNVAYFGNTDISNFQNYVIHGAVVTIWDGTQLDTLKEVFPGLGYYYVATYMTGVIGKTYLLTINHNSKTYTASTTIPAPVPLDSIWFQVQGNMDSLGYIWAHLSDPPGLGQQYRWFAKRLNKDSTYLPPYGSVFDDKFIDGESFDFAYNRGRVPNSDAEDDLNIEAYFFKKQDTVVVKFCTLDADAYKFYRQYETEILSAGNPFAAPTSIPSNIYPKGEVLGVFCGYGVWMDTLITQ
jgi:hypothetical protein